MHGRTDNHASAPGQDGLALPTVIILGLVMFLVVSAVAFRGVIGIHQADDQRKYNNALQIADGGIDKVLHRLVDSKTFVTATPLTSGGTAQSDAAPSPTQDERAWALSKAGLKNASDSSPDPLLSELVKTNEGEWAVIKPTGSDVVYAVGYVPSRANATRTRVLRVEYDFPPFNAVNAILTGGNLKIGGNASIAGSAGSIHTNGDFSWQGGAWGVTGSVGASGAFGSSATIPNQIGDKTNSGGGKAEQSIPVLDPAEPSTYALVQYDLCPDGSVRGGPANPDGFANTTGTPCGGPLQSAAGVFKGWTPTVGSGSGLTTPTTWKYQTDTCNNGVFFAKWGTIQVKGNPGKDGFTCQGQPWQATLLASTRHTSPGDCPHYGGDIDVTGTPKIRPYSTAGGILMMAGRDFKMLGNAAGGGANLQGSISVHEQFDVSGNMTLTGNIIANDDCDTSGSPVSQNIVNLQGSSSITFNNPVELPLGKLIRITRWTEL